MIKKTILAPHSVCVTSATTRHLRSESSQSVLEFSQGTPIFTRRNLPSEEMGMGYAARCGAGRQMINMKSIRGALVQIVVCQFSKNLPDSGICCVGIKSLASMKICQRWRVILSFILDRPFVFNVRGRRCSPFTVVAAAVGQLQAGGEIP